MPGLLKFIVASWGQGEKEKIQSSPKKRADIEAKERIWKRLLAQQFSKGRLLQLTPSQWHLLSNYVLHQREGKSTACCLIDIVSRLVVYAIFPLARSGLVSSSETLS